MLQATFFALLMLEVRSFVDVLNGIFASQWLLALRTVLVPAEMPANAITSVKEMLAKYSLILAEIQCMTDGI